MKIQRKPANFFRKAWHSLPAELSKGALKGQLIRLTKPKRYRELKKIRPNRSEIARQKNQLVKNIKNQLSANNVSFVSVFGRVKTLGSLDRKEKYSRKKFPDQAEKYMKEDFIGVTVIVESVADCHSVFNVIKNRKLSRAWF